MKKQNSTLPQADKYKTKHKRRRIWQKVVGSLACLVVFVTTYMLILPAITMEQQAYCGLEEHQHDESCYEVHVICGHEGEIPDWVLAGVLGSDEDDEEIIDEEIKDEDIEDEDVTEEESGDIHHHGDNCYAQKWVLVCGQEESTTHIHNENCVCPGRTLICGLEEDPGHIHNEECKRSEQIASDSDASHEQNEEYICGMEEGEGSHIHTDDCYEESEYYICSPAEGEEGHVHGEECYELREILICKKAEADSEEELAEAAGQTKAEEAAGQTQQSEGAEQVQQAELVDTADKEEVSGETEKTEETETPAETEPMKETEAPAESEPMKKTEPTAESELTAETSLAAETDPAVAADPTAEAEPAEETEAPAESGQPAASESARETEPTEDSGGKTAEDSAESLTDETTEESKEETTEESIEESIEKSTEDMEHIHTAGCFEIVLVCEMEEHEHSLICFSDVTADVEDEAAWKASVSGVELTGVWADDVIAIAASQFGYVESTRNYTVDENDEMKGYTRYGAWYGDEYGDWCAMFVSFCLHYAEIPDSSVPYEANCGNWVQILSEPEWDLYRECVDYTPVKGDIIFFDFDGDGSADHVGLVEEVEDDILITIEGNVYDRVTRREYKKTESKILGYGVLENSSKVVMHTAVLYTDKSYATLSEDSTVITVTGVIPADAEIRAYPVKIEQEGQILCAYDITVFLPDGTLFQPEEERPLEVAIQSDALTSPVLGEDVRPEVYFVPENGEPERLETTVTEDGVAFEAKHFSVYMVRAVQGTEVSNADELKAAITNGDSYIQLAADFAVSEMLTIPANSDITLDLNGHVLTASAALFAIPANAKLTVVDNQQGTETVETLSDDLAGNEAILLDDKLVYYVTTTSVTIPAAGATQETLEKHTIRTAGAIVGGSQPVFQVTGGTLHIQSGMIRGGTGRAIFQNSGTSNLSGGYICGFTQSSGNTDNTSFGGAVYASKGTLELSGTVLTGNTAHNGGAIYATGSTKISITGGVISGNTSNRTTSGWNDHSESGAYRCGGGGIYADRNAEITMSGGYITNNIATHDGYFDGGGGVCLSGASAMALSDGYVTGNQAQGGGGIRTDFGKETTFVMTGGFVSANVATHAEGGGIAIDRNGVGTITGGYITNNKIPNTGHWGGGGLFCADGSTLNLKNTLITENTAGGFGAGVAGCPTGNLYLYVTEGCAIYDNTDTVDSDSPHFTSDGVKQIDKEICTEVFQSNGHADYFCALNSTVTGTMLGNHAANWQGSADYQPVIAEADDLLSATRVMGLQAHPTEEAKRASESAAKVYINGNYSYTHGGGIMCNGNLVIGVPVNVEVPARIDLQATKKLVDGSGNAQSLKENDFSFKVTMTEPDGTVVASGTCGGSGKITFDHQLTFKQEGTFVYYIYEEADEENISVTYDPTLYRLTVTVNKDNGVAWYGDTIKYTYSVTSVKVESSADGENWTQVSQNDTSQSGIISLPLTSGTTFTNYLIEPTKVTVQKKWEGGSGTDSVTVILKQDGEEWDRQTLSAENGWIYTWDKLENGHTYTVEEVPVDGYTTSYEITTSTDDSGSTSLGQGSWWVPAAELTAGQQYLIVSPDGAKALYIASGNEGQGFDTADVTDVVQQQTALTVNSQIYSTWYQAADIPARSIYHAELLTRDSHSGIILKRSDDDSYPYLRLESNNNNYLKGGSATKYASFMVFDGIYLKGHNASEWTPDNLRTVIYADGKFNTTTEQNPANAAKLYMLVSGEGFTGSTTDSTTVVITNTKDANADYELPETGGIGKKPYTIGGALVTAAVLFLLYNHIMRRKEGSASS